jgi:hypothetical protein
MQFFHSSFVLKHQTQKAYQAQQMARVLVVTKLSIWHRAWYDLVETTIAS